MSDHVTQRADGRREAAFSFRPPWWDQGYQVEDHFQTSREILTNALLDWEVEQNPVYFSWVDENHLVHQVQIPDQVANVRADNKNFLGIVSKRYKVVNNWEAFDFVDCLHQDGIMKYESAGSLKGGKVVWMLAKMPQEFEVVAGDKLEQYILFTTAHDGTRAVRVLPTSVRVVCWNTLSLATANESKGLSIRHKGNIKDKLDDARKVIMNVQQKFDGFHQTARKMTEVSFDMDRMKILVELLIPKENGKNDTRRVKARRSILNAFKSHRQNLPGMRDTAWAAFNAVTEHVDHSSSYKGKNTALKSERRMESLMLGANARLKQSALNLITEVANA